MKTTIKTTGMMCGKCEARVTKALLDIDGITSCVADATSGNVIVDADNDAVIDAAKKTIYDIGYEVI